MNFEDLRNDFEVRYRFLEPEEDGRKTGQPYQGYRCDWRYAEFDENQTEKLQMWMIWPIFLDSDGVPLLGGTHVARVGTARMFILNEELRKTVHRERIRLGTRGYFMEGSRRVAEAEVIRVVTLMKDDL